MALRDRLVRLYDESRRRGVLRVAAVYLVSAWLAIQVADVTFPRVGLPDRAVTFVIVLLAALFPVVVALTWIFDLTRTGARHEPDPERDVTDADGMVTPARVRARVPVILAAVLAFPLVAFGMWWVNDARAADLDTQLVAVTPFRVAGASAELEFLREGLMDLIAARIGGEEGGLRVVAPRTMSRLIREQLGSIDADPDREAAMDLAIELGAGRLLQGEVVGTESSIRVSATLYNVQDGRIIETHPFAPVSTDSLHALVDAIVTQLIAAGSGLRADRLASITTRSVPALRSFIEAEHAFRRGEHQRAVQAYDHAVQLDTTFALAALGLLRARGWALSLETETDWEQARRIVRRGVDRLGVADRAFFDVFNRGPNERQRDRITNAARAAERHPDQADLQYLAADRLLHYGSLVGIEGAVERARLQLERVVAMDSAYGEPLYHLYELAVAREDTAGVRRYGDLLLRIDSMAPYATKVRYNRSLGRDGRGAGAPVALDTIPIDHLDLLTHPGWSMATPEDVRREYLQRWGAARLPEEVRHTSLRVAVIGMRGGEPSLIEEIDRRAGGGEWVEMERLVRALYWLRDRDAASAAAEPVRTWLDEARGSVETRPQQIVGECLLGHYAIAVDDAEEASRVLERIVPDSSLPQWAVAEADVCRRYLRAGSAVISRADNASRSVAQLDEFLSAGPDIDEYMAMVYLLGLARLWEELGEPERALEVVRRRLYVPYAQHWVNELNGEQARLADALGRRDEAIAAYRAYLSYFYAPEPPFDRRVARARERLAALVGESRN